MRRAIPCYRIIALCLLGFFVFVAVSGRFVWAQTGHQRNAAETYSPGLLSYGPRDAASFPLAGDSGSCTQIVFTDIRYNAEKGGIDILLCVPDGVTNIDVFGTADLPMDPHACSLLASNCPPSSNILALSWMAGNADVLSFSSGDSSVDTDNDGLSDAREMFMHGTKPDDPDTDHDGLSDGWEWRNGLDSLDPVGINGGEGDPDGDSLNNLAEQAAGTGPRKANLVVDLSPTDVVRECRGVSTFHHKVGYPELTNASSQPKFYLRLDESYSTENTLMSTTPARRLVGSNFADIDPCDGFVWGVTHEIRTWADYDDYGNIYCTDYPNIQTNSNPIMGWVHRQGSQVQMTSTSYRWNFRYDYYTGLHLDCSGLQNGDAWYSIDYVLTLSSEYTTPMLATCAVANLATCGGIASVPWGSARFVDMGQCSATNYSGCQAVRDLTRDEDSISMSQLQYRYRFNSEPGVMYRLTWVHWFTAEGFEEEELHDAGEVLVLGTGGTQYIESPDFLIDPPAYDGYISPDIMTMDLVPDWNRDRAITPADENRVSPVTPFRMWINDDMDSGDISEGDRDVPGQGGLFSTANGEDAKVNGRSDLVDFFPLWLDLYDVLMSFSPYLGAEYRISQADGAIRVVYTGLTKGNAGSFLTIDDTDCGPYLTQKAYEADTFKVTSSGVLLPLYFLDQIMTDPSQGVLLIEGVASTKAPLVLEVLMNGVRVCKKELPLSVDGVEKMYRHLNLRPDGDGNATAVGEPPNYPDSMTPGDKNVLFLHGFKVSGNKARGWNAEMFKRLYQAGSNGRFWGVTWQGDLGLIDALHYQENVANSFQVASNLANKAKALPNVTVLAHSLGNMVVSAAIEDYGFTPDSFFMLNAAVAAEAYDQAEFNTSVVANPLVHEDWVEYKPDTWSASWHKLFVLPDDRARLTWRNRFSSVLNYAYNFYSSGDEIFELYEGNPGPFSGGLFHLEQYAWHKQEILKGRTDLGSTDEAGWGFSSAYSLDEANLATEENLRTNAVFRHEPDEMFTSNITRQVQNSILALGIPSLSGAAGSLQIDDAVENYDLGLYVAADWPRAGYYFGRWLHSDLKDIAYVYVYPLYDKIVIDGGLK